jgi:hypothetical protein
MSESMVDASILASTDEVSAMSKEDVHAATTAGRCHARRTTQAFVDLV